MMAHTCNFSLWGVEAGRAEIIIGYRAQGQSGLCETLAPQTSKQISNCSSFRKIILGFFLILEIGTLKRWEHIGK